MTARKELLSLTGLRGLATLGVFFCHTSLPWSFIQMGASGVSLFFVLSGFILTYTHIYTSKPCEFSNAACFKSFWWRRFARIYPAHEVTLLVALPQLACVLQGHCYRIVQIPFSILLLHNWVPVQLFGWNPPTWTLSLEVAFYLGFPWLVRIATHHYFWVFGFWALPYVIIAAGGWSETCFVDSSAYAHLFVRNFILIRLSEFIMGIWAAKVYTQHLHILQHHQLFRVLTLGLLPVILGLCIFLFPWLDPYMWPGIFTTGAVSPLFVWLILGLAVFESDAWLSRLLACRPIYYFGQLSYTFYLIHYSFLDYIKGRMAEDDIFFVPLWFFWTVGVASCVHFLVEKPVYAWLTQRVYPSSCTCGPCPLLV